MRNDTHDDPDDVPVLHVGARDDAPLRAAHGHPRPPRTASTGPLWALLGAACIALAGLGWWSAQQIALLEQQLVATQESFARISEDAAGRLNVISGRVEARDSSVSTDTEALKLQLRQLQTALAEQGKQQAGVAGQAGDLDKRLEQVLAESQRQQTALGEAQARMQAQVESITTDLAALKAAQVDGRSVEDGLKRLDGELAALKKQGDPTTALNDLQQDMLVLKAQLENRPAASATGGASVQEFDAFRTQVSRNLNTLQSQVQNLQQQINAGR
ncbi:ATPase [Pseudomonas alabamensis]|jgi:chromosome segregation ATPase|uniref:ATPase n=1 Tax=Pseudomonas alabamensis TaxID=3064349 RepID=UPI003F64D726